MVLLGWALPGRCEAVDLADSPAPSADETAEGAVAPAASKGAAAPSASTPDLPPLDIELRADEQGYDQATGRFTARGNVRVSVAGGRLQADALEYDSRTRILWARGSVRFERGSQRIQASSLRYSLLQKEGELEDVYGVVDLLSSELDLNPDAPLAGTPEGQAADQRQRLNLLQNPPRPGTPIPPASVAPLAEPEPLSCPPVLPPLPRQPYPQALTLWGGQMTDATFGETFIFQGATRPEGVGGLGYIHRLVEADPFALEIDSNLLLHVAGRNNDLRYTAGVPPEQASRAVTDPQTFAEVTFGLGLRWWIRPWLSLQAVEGVSLLSALSNYETVSWQRSTQFLNYLGAELAVDVSPQWTVVGRIHHRSGAYGTYAGVYEGSNGYLLGARYRFGRNGSRRPQADDPPPLGCPGGDTDEAMRRQPLAQQLEAAAMDPEALDGPETSAPPPPPPPAPSRASVASRRSAIAAIDQRVRDVQPRQGLILDRRFGTTDASALSSEEGQYGVVAPEQLQELRATKNRRLITGSITHWRFQAPALRLTPEGWSAPRASFTNDPFTPAQVWVDADEVISWQEADGTTVIRSRGNRLLLENKLPVPLPSTLRVKPQQDKEVQNRWALLNDRNDRDGLYLQYTLPEQKLGSTSLTVRPQFMVQRAINGSNDAYPAPGASAGSDAVNQPNTLADLFGVEAQLEGPLGQGGFNANLDISSFAPDRLANATRANGELRQPLTLPWVGETQGRLFGAYRYRVWNGSLGQQDIYAAYGGFLGKQGLLPAPAGVSASYIWRLGVGNYQSNLFAQGNQQSVDLEALWRGNLYASANLRLPLWTGQSLPLTSEGAYRYSPVPVVPGLSLSLVPFTNLAAYGNGDSQSLLGISGGPTLTLGHFNRPVLDFTRLSIFGSVTAKGGDSPLAFDRYVDTATLGVGLTQQLVGPLLLNGGIEYNVSGSSGEYGKTTNSYVELRWQRRAYDIGAYYSPYTGIGGLRIRLNDFGFRGPGVPFVPWEPRRGELSEP